MSQSCCNFGLYSCSPGTHFSIWLVSHGLADFLYFSFYHLRVDCGLPGLAELSIAKECYACLYIEILISVCPNSSGKHTTKARTAANRLRSSATMWRDMRRTGVGTVCVLLCTGPVCVCGPPSIYL